ncbi:MAG: NADH-quinone oxidoreductase subunit C [Acidimicrobiales bacterium]|nr:NADH-quinone oxidoreductase subunit C [Acidimicrobiales bacterium]
MNQKVAHVSRDQYYSYAESLYEDGFHFASDLCGVDYLGNQTRVLPDSVTPERFEVVVSLLSHGSAERIRLRVQIPESDPHVSTLMGIYPGVENMEREAFDLVGIVFDGHPDMTRILLPDGWEGHPLRKDYSVGRVPVQFKGAPGPR